MKDETDERLVGERVRVERKVLGCGESVNDRSPHSRHKLKLEGERRVNRHKAFLSLQKPGILEGDISLADTNISQLERSPWGPLWHWTVVQHSFLQSQRAFYKPALTRSSYHLIFSPFWSR